MNCKIAAMMVVGIGILINLGCQTGGRNCNNCSSGCRPGPIGWQRGGTNYNQSLGRDAYQQQPPGSGVQAAQVGYPYYTHRGPRDFFLNNPPTIGR